MRRKIKHIARDTQAESYTCSLCIVADFALQFEY